MPHTHYSPIVLSPITSRYLCITCPGCGTFGPVFRQRSATITLWLCRGCWPPPPKGKNKAALRAARGNHLYTI